MENEKEFVGTICGHHNKIIKDGDAYCVQFSDVCGDVCEDCFTKYDIKNACDMTPESVSPYDNNISDYWYGGTLDEYIMETFKDTAQVFSEKYDYFDNSYMNKETNTFGTKCSDGFGVDLKDIKNVTSVNAYLQIISIMFDKLKEELN